MPTIGRFITIVCLCWLYLLGVAGAQDQPLRLTDEALGKDFLGKLSTLRDPDGDLTPSDALAATWTPEQGSNVDFGYTTDKIWLRFDLENATEEGADAVDRWYIRYRENFFQEFAVYRVDPDGTITTLEDQIETSPFDSRRVSYAELSVLVDLAPGETTTILTRYRSGGSSELSMSIMTEQRFNAFAASMTARNFAFYGMMILLIAAAGALYLVQGQFVFATYACYATSTLLFVMHVDGNTFRFLWPEAPVFNGYASILLGSAMTVFGANFVRHYLQTFEKHPRLELILRILIVMTLGIFASSAFVDHQLIKKTLILFTFGSVILFTVAGVVAARTRFREVRFYLLAWVGALLSSAIMLGRHYFGIEISEEAQFNSMRVVLVADAAMMGFAIVDRINQMKKAQQHALERSLSEARRSLRLSERLQTLERQYAVAQDLAQNQSRHVADTLHDLRGPLHALRLNLNAQSSGATEPSSDVEQTLSYLETLVSDEMNRYTSEPAAVDLSPPAQSDLNEINPVLTAVFDMFVAEAQSKGLFLHVVPTTATTKVPPFALMRIASNLVSNAVKYTDEGRVLIGVRHGGSKGLRLEVHDTGPGLSETAFAQAMGRSDRLGRTDDAGHGLGLSIVQDTVDQHGLDIGLTPGRTTGTGLYVTLT